MGRWTVGLLPGMRCTWRWEPSWRPPVWDGWSAKAGSVGRPNGQGKESSLRRFEGAVRGTRLPVKASACAWTWQQTRSKSADKLDEAYSGDRAVGPLLWDVGGRPGAA